MTNNFVPVEKMSKKQRKAYFSKHRNVWENVNPVTRTVPGKKGYDRKKMKDEDRRHGGLSEGGQIIAVPFFMTKISL